MIAANVKTDVKVEPEKIHMNFFNNQPLTAVVTVGVGENVGKHTMSGLSEIYLSKNETAECNNRIRRENC